MCSTGKEWKEEEMGKSGRSLLAILSRSGSQSSAIHVMELCPSGTSVCCSQYS